MVRPAEAEADIRDQPSTPRAGNATVKGTDRPIANIRTRPSDRWQCAVQPTLSLCRSAAGLGQFRSLVRQEARDVNGCFPVAADVARRKIAATNPPQRSPVAFRCNPASGTAAGHGLDPALPPPADAGTTKCLTLTERDQGNPGIPGKLSNVVDNLLAPPARLSRRLRSKLRA